MTEQIHTAPQLIASPPGDGRMADPPEAWGPQADRIRALHESIWNDPYAYLDALSFMGNLALSTEDALPDAYDSAPTEVGQLLVAYLADIGAIRRTGFDEESDEAIYGNPEVRRRILLNKHLTADHIPAGPNRTVTADRASAKPNRDQLTTYKLFLFVRRVRLYQEQTQAAGKSEQVSAA